MSRAALALSLVLFSVARAAAQAPADDGPGLRASAPPSTVPDATLAALRGRTIRVELAAGQPVVGELVGFDATSMTLALVPTRDVCTLARAGVTGLRLADAPPSPPVVVVAPPATANALVAAPPERERNFGLQLGLAPALTLDYEAGHFYGFVSADVVLPMASSGDLLGFGVGGGASFHVIAGSRWRLDVFAHFTPARVGTDSWSLGGGIGLGMHYTARNGFTLGFKVPILGYSGFTNSQSNDAGSDVGFYYLGALMGLPVISLGYRF